MYSNNNKYSIKNIQLEFFVIVILIKFCWVFLFVCFHIIPEVIFFNKTTGSLKNV